MSYLRFKVHKVNNIIQVIINHQIAYVYESDQMAEFHIVLILI